MRHPFLLFLMATFLLVSCQGQKEVPFNELKSNYQTIKEMGELSTVEYNVGKILKIDDQGPWYKLGDRKILISVKANVKAGVDLTELKEEDIEINGNTIKIELPAAKLFSFYIPNDQVQTVVNDVNGLRHEFSQQDKMNIIKLGEKEIRTEVSQTNILKDAELNAIAWFKSYYQNMGFEQVTVTSKRTLL